MAYDGLFIHSQLNELRDVFLNERISRIVQPNNKTVDFIIRKNNKDIILSISINPNFPYISILRDKNNLSTNPPGFCMLLRKYLSSGTILNINQIDGRGNTNSFERIIDIQIKNVNQKGDMNLYHLIVELLGRYSNVYITDENFIIIDILNKINYETSSIRVLKPKDEYNTINLDKKHEINKITFDEFISILNNQKNKYAINNEFFDLTKLIINSFYGLSKTFIEHILHKLNIDKNLTDMNLLLTTDSKISYSIFSEINMEIEKIINKNIKPKIFYQNGVAKDFHVIDLSIYNEKVDEFETANDCVVTYQNIKFQNILETNEKSNLLSTINNLIIRTTKKISKNEEDIEKNKDFEKYRIYGELINAFLYNNKLNDKNELLVENYYDNNKIIAIPINKEYSMQKNAEKYFDKYNKAKRTIVKSKELLSINENSLEHLQSIKESVEYIEKSSDLQTIKYELSLYFNIKTNTNKKRKEPKKNAINVTHYKTSDGIDIYVGKNNIQNEYVTFDIASSNDTWFHVKNATGSHVIIKKPYDELDMKTIEKVASLAAFYSSMRHNTKTTVDYTLRKELKKVKGKAPGFLIYHKNYSINVEPKNFFE